MLRYLVHISSNSKEKNTDLTRISIKRMFTRGYSALLFQKEFSWIDITTLHLVQKHYTHRENIKTIINLIVIILQMVVQWILLIFHYPITEETSPQVIYSLKLIRNQHLLPLQDLLNSVVTTSLLRQLKQIIFKICLKLMRLKKDSSNNRSKEFNLKWW